MFAWFEFDIYYFEDDLNETYDLVLISNFYIIQIELVDLIFILFVPGSRCHDRRFGGLRCQNQMFVSITFEKTTLKNTVQKCALSVDISTNWSFLLLLCLSINPYAFNGIIFVQYHSVRPPFICLQHMFMAGYLFRRFFVSCAGPSKNQLVAFKRFDFFFFFLVCLILTQFVRCVLYIISYIVGI